MTLYKSLGDSPEFSRTRLLDCVLAVEHWFLLNDLLLNSSKSEVITFGSAFQINKLLAAPSYSIASTNISPVTHIKIVGVTLDDKLNFDRYVSATCSACSFQLRALRHIRPLIDESTANAFACISISTRLDYCNSLLSGVSVHNISRLQRIQNIAVRVVCNAPRRHSATDLLKKLHWLPVTYRINYKLVLTTFKALTNTASPSYIRDLINVYEPGRSLRSSSANQLVVPSAKDHNKTVLASRAYQNFAPNLWNNLSPYIRSLAFSNTPPTIDFLKRKLKADLLTAAFG